MRETGGRIERGLEGVLRKGREGGLEREKERGGGGVSVGGAADSIPRPPLVSVPLTITCSLHN